MRVTFTESDHTYRDEAGVLVPGVTGTLSDAGLIDGSEWFTEFSRNRGSMIHLATALYDRGELDMTSVDDRIVGYVNAWIAFRRDSRFEPVLIEHVVAHDNPRFAGTLDRAGVMGGKKVLLDIKTGKMPRWTALQTAAYQRCVPEYTTRCGIELRDDGTYRLHTFGDRYDWTVFAAALAVACWKMNNTLHVQPGREAGGL